MPTRLTVKVSSCSFWRENRVKGHLASKMKKNKKRNMGDFSADYSGVVLLGRINPGEASIK